ALINFDKAISSPKKKGECAFIAKMAKAEAYWLLNKLILQQKNGHRVKIHAAILNSLNSIGV
ncbi:MAG: hypothetical protein V3U02_03870, partial [Calditrichia bacterium]